MSPEDSVQDILNEVENGRPGASERLFAAVYDELKLLGRQRMRGEAAGISLQTTDLVNEAFLRLVGGERTEPAWENRRHFFGAAAEAMRRILVDHARAKKAAKRGGGAKRVQLSEELPVLTGSDVDLLALDEALGRLEARDPRRAAVVKHRFFLGLTVAETADCLDVSPRTVDDDWAFARAWLHREITGRG